MKHGHGVTNIAVFPDGRRALTGSWDRTFGVWDLDTGQQLRRISGIAGQFDAVVAVSPDSRRALFGPMMITPCGSGTWRWERRSSDSRGIQRR